MSRAGSEPNAAITVGRATPTCEYRCDGERLRPGDFVLLPKGVPHTFVVGPDEPLHSLQLTTPAGFEGFAAGALNGRALLVGRARTGR